MEELIARLKEKVGISEQQAVQVITEIKEYVKEKFPMLSGVIDNMFEQ